MSKLKTIIKEAIVEHLLSEEAPNDTSHIDIHSKLKLPDYKPYSHGSTKGYVQKTKDKGVKHKDVHTQLKDNGYRYVNKISGLFGDKEGDVHHIYTKKAGPYHEDHEVSIITNKAGFISQIESTPGTKDLS